MGRNRDPRSTLGSWLEHRTRHIPPARALRFELILAALGRLEPDGEVRLLDAGGGDGLLAEQLGRRHPRWTIVVADVNQEMLDRGRARVRTCGPTNIRFDRADLTGDLGREAYDAVVACECLPEIERDDLALASMARALRPGGVLLAHVPECRWSPALPGSDRQWRYEVRHGYGARELVSKLERAGLTDIAVTPTSRTAVRVGQEIAERLKDAGLRRRALAYPLLAAAVRLERWHLTWGPARALLVEARRPRAA